MKKGFLLVLFLGLILVLSLSGCGNSNNSPSGPTGPVVKFQENFESYSIQNPWTSPNWTDSNTGIPTIWMISFDGSKVFQHVNINGRRIYNNYNGTDYTLSAKMKPGDIGTSAGILARFSDANHYYGLTLESNTLVLRKFPQTGGNPFTNFTFNTTTYYTLTLKVSGHHITGQVTDGVTTANVSINDDGTYDANPVNATGKIGLSELGATGTRFDDIKVTEP